MSVGDKAFSTFKDGVGGGDGGGRQRLTQAHIWTNKHNGILHELLAHEAFSEFRHLDEFPAPYASVLTSVKKWVTVSACPCPHVPCCALQGRRDAPARASNLHDSEADAATSERRGFPLPPTYHSRLRESQGAKHLFTQGQEQREPIECDHPTNTEDTKNEKYTELDNLIVQVAALMKCATDKAARRALEKEAERAASTSQNAAAPRRRQPAGSCSASMKRRRSSSRTPKQIDVTRHHVAACASLRRLSLEPGHRQPLGSDARAH